MEMFNNNLPFQNVPSHIYFSSSSDKIYKIEKHFTFADLRAQNNLLGIIYFFLLIS